MKVLLKFFPWKVNLGQPGVGTWRCLALPWLWFWFYLLVAASSSAQTPGLDRLGVKSPDLSQADPTVRQQIEEAEALVEALAVPTERGSEFSEGLLTLGKIYLAYDFIEGAQSAFEVVLETSRAAAESLLEPLYYLSYCQERSGDAELALATTDRALVANPRHLQSQLRRGRLLLQLERLSEAQTQFESARNEDPGCAAASYGLGEVARSTGDHQQAVEHYLEALENSPELGQVRYALGLTYRRLGRVAEARSELERAGGVNAAAAAATWAGCADPLLDEVRSFTTGAAPHLLRGSLAYFSGDLQKAVEQYRLALAASPEDPVVRKTLAAALFSVGDTAGAEEHFQAAVDLAPERAAYRYDLAEVLRSRGAVEEAALQYRAAIEQSPQFAQAWARLGDVSFGAGRFDEAVKNYSRAVETDPGDAATRAALGVALLQTGNRERGLRELTKSLEQPPEEPQKYLELAEVLLLFGGVDAALAHFQTILEGDPPAVLAARAHLWLGSVALGRKENNKARAHLSTALTLDPTLEQARTTLQQIQD